MALSCLEHSAQPPAALEQARRGLVSPAMRADPAMAKAEGWTTDGFGGWNASVSDFIQQHMPEQS